MVSRYQKKCCEKMKQVKYNVAIRTIGKAGDKYVREIQSLQLQSVPPHRIVVYIAEGFALPPKVGMEEYVIVPKGLVHQRAVIPDDDVDYLLIMDDDVFVPHDGVENMVEMMDEYGVDCVIPDTFPNHKMTWRQKLIAYMSNDVSGRRDDGYAMRIKRSGAFSYNNNPKKKAVLPTQSGAGPVFFVKRKAFEDIRYSDELWVDNYPPGTFYEDQLMYYKMYVNGCRMVTWFDSGVEHLDAGTNNQREKSYEKLMYRAMANYMIWHRSVLGGTHGVGKWLCCMAYFYRFIMGLLTRVVFAVMCVSSKHVTAYVKGNMEGMRLVRSREYKALPSFIINKKQEVCTI